MSVVVDEKEEFDFALPFQVTLQSESEEVVLGNQSNIPSGEIRLKVDEPFSLYARNQGSYRLGLNLFGRFRFKEIRLDVVDTHYAVPCGVPVGIYLRSSGIMVIGTGRIRCQSGEEKEPAYGILQSGDYIEAINGEPLLLSDLGLASHLEDIAQFAQGNLTVTFGIQLAAACIILPFWP